MDQMKKAQHKMYGSKSLSGRRGIFLRKRKLHWVTESLTKMVSDVIFLVSSTAWCIKLERQKMKFKVHLTPKFFFAKSNLLVIRTIWTQKFLNLRESSIFYALSKLPLKSCTTEFKGVWGGSCWWRLPRNQTQWRPSQLSVFARENGKQN